MNNIIVPDQEKFEKIKFKIKSTGADNIHILTDFDRTLTYAKSSNGKDISSMISILRDGNYLTKEYAEQARSLFFWDL